MTMPTDLKSPVSGRTLGRGLFLVLLLVLTAATAQAHSTKGRIKVPLEKESIGVDDVAYFVESHVHKRMYSDNTPATEQRFVVSEFKDLKQNGSRAEVQFIVLDKQTNDTFDGSMILERGETGVWRFSGGNGIESMDVPTYVPKGRYYWQKYGVGLSVAGIAVCLGILAFSIVQRKNRTADEPDFSRDGEEAMKGEPDGAA